MNGASAGAGPGAGGEGPLVYQAWKGSNVREPLTSPRRLSSSPHFFVSCVDLCVHAVVTCVWCELTVPF